MKTIGLTGGIGSGKSLVASIFVQLGVPVFSADEAGRSILDHDESVRAAVSELFGSDAYNSGRANRSLIAGIVFGDPEKLEKLNAIIHPAVSRSFIAWYGNQLASGKAYCIRESAILFESNTHGDCDEVIVVEADLEVRVKRTMQRDGVSRDTVKKRIANQWTDEQRLAKATLQINNNGEAAVIPQVVDLHFKLRR
ncbi:MAG TPA: dephospho-CoA kinase [Flavobacteriales bacterium]|jgi:dephospho-CoA kinase|nr:dephospho-CoA kinase [Flavobacteriales bacterium]HAW18665.1 dephospho-CoA kinase [Flavobacteriales bacterium]